jgi:hypothetical protein
MEYLWAYLVGLVIVIVLNTQFFRKWRNIIHYENIFFLFFLNLGFTWIAIFFSFYTLQDADIALLLSHCSYLISILYIYSFVGFIYFFDTQNSLKIDQKQIILILTGLIGLTILYLSPWITVSMYLDTAGIFRENPWELSIIHTIFTLWAFPIILYTVYNKLRKIRLLARIRFTRIIYSTSLLIVIFVFFQLIFPIYYGIWIFEKELIVIYFMYIGYVSYIIHRYYFASVLQNIWSWIISILAIIFVTEMYTFSDTILPIIGNSFDNFWTQEKPSHYTITILIIVLYLFIVSTLRRIFIWRWDREELKEDILHLQKKIIPITDYISLNILIRKTFKYIFHTHHAEVIIFSEDDTYLHTKNYFQKGDFDNLYIADIVFLEQKREWFPIEGYIYSISNFPYW